MTDKTQALESLIAETISFYQRLQDVAERLHGFRRLSGGKRGVLRDLYQNGMQTVPEMARSRPVSRQHIQTIVNPLFEEGLVEFVENPAHRRSKLVRLTQRGVDLLEEMNRREMELLSEIEIDISEKDILNSASVLKSIRVSLNTKKTKELIKNFGTGRKKDE
ncbi:MAG: MarR family transcriptional regulator [Deltaproteobacteria bacterium]|uniref:MarR family transcriptional regulator n=1 Tax=Candidatus Zymogenus saltonus TaxID=2844893 RepID=A0A9D8KFS7_9DELT|nr:MarR family transcriptional regulator [Candidatus Zymogenus saltonus]